MCGIIGTTGNNKESLLKDALVLLGHRGPDDTGIFTDAHVSLGHTRLSIIDLSPSGYQPMRSNTMVISFNGEIYNYKELSDHLKNQGVQFVGKSDTEVILRGYELEGISFFEKLRGMWAFAIYDQSKKQLVLSRDHFGIKPLYYSIQDGILSFSSEIKALKSLVPKMTPHTSMYYAYFNLGYFPGEDTSFKEVRKIDPGSVLIWDIEAHIEHRQQLRMAAEPVSSSMLFDEAVSFMEDVLHKSVEAHFVSDVEVGLLLSGGVDSSLLAALSARLGKKPTCYHVAIPGSIDTVYARNIARHLGLDLEERELSNTSLHQGYAELGDYIDLPTSDLSIIPTALVYKAIHKDSKVVLSGEGGDELFGGYLRHSALQQTRQIYEKPAILGELLSRLYTTGSLGINLINPLLHRIQQNVGIKTDDVIGTCLLESKTLGFPIDEDKIRRKLSSLYHNHPYRNLTPTNLFFDQWMYLPDSLLYKNDIASMASSIEARVPLVDRCVVASVASLPAKYRLSEAYNGKRLLKEMLGRYIPAELIERPKKGFGFSFQSFDAPFFVDDYKKAAQFHLENASSFGINKQMELLLRGSNSQDVCRKFPRFAFSLITNHMVMKKYWH